jgi:hypothetical protein
MTHLAQTLRLALMMVIALPTAACVGGAEVLDEENVDSAELAATSTNRMSLNRMSLNRMSLNGLSSTALSSNGLSLSQTGLLATVEGRELLTYVVRCALPADKTLTGTDGGTSYTFQGLIGLAPEWVTTPLSQKGQRWMTACLLAHANGFGIEVPISLRGNHPALGTTGGERGAYSRQEVSFFGNVFQPTDKVDELGDVGPRLYSCGGFDLQEECGGSDATFKPTRACGTAEECGLAFAGACKDLTSLSADVCANESADGYAKCHSAAKDEAGRWPKGAAYNEVITVYLTNSDFNSLYSDCVPMP